MFRFKYVNVFEAATENKHRLNKWQTGHIRQVETAGCNNSGGDRGKKQILREY